MEDSEFVNATSSKKAVLSHAWSEVIKYVATKRNHDKMFIDDEIDLGQYLGYLKSFGDMVGCNMNVEVLLKYDKLYIGFTYFDDRTCNYLTKLYFDDNYLFSDACSLYFKGVNIFPHIFGEQWKKYVPILNLSEIKRQVSKTIGREFEALIGGMEEMESTKNIER
jgi:hypothetical protein